jgi:hypothetical protein
MATPGDIPALAMDTRFVCPLATYFVFVFTGFVPLARGSYPLVVGFVI